MKKAGGKEIQEEILNKKEYIREVRGEILKQLQLYYKAKNDEESKESKQASKKQIIEL